MSDRITAQDVLSAIHIVDLAEDDRAVVHIYSAFITKLGFESIALGYVINPANTGAETEFQVTTWPDDWVERWRGSDFIIHDPIARYSLRTRQPFTWKTAYEHGSRFGQVILDESRNFGFKDGLAIPIHTVNRPPGCVSLGAEIVDLSPTEQGCLELVTFHVYARLETLCGVRPFREIRTSLTRREIDVLQYAAAGKTNWEIGQILSLQEATVKEYMSSAMHKLGCVNRAHTVAVAIQKNLILP